MNVSDAQATPLGDPSTDALVHNTDTKPNEPEKETTPTEIETKDKVDVKEGKENNKNRSVSFNRDVHVKRFGKPRETRGASAEPQVRREPFTHLSEQELIDEANKVLEQAQSVTCTSDQPPEKFFSLPHRRKYKERTERRNSDDSTPEGKLGRSNSDVNSRKRRDRTSLSTLFRRAQTNRNKSPVEPVVVTTKPTTVVKRSKSDVTDLKSNTKLNTQTKPIRKRSGSETEEFLKSLRNKKTQLSPIIESSPREDYFKKTSPLEVFEKQKLSQKNSAKSENQDKKINPVVKPPRFKTPEKQEPRPPTRTKRGRSSDKELSPPIGETPKRKTEIKKTLLVDEIDSSKPKDSKTVEVKDKIKESIRKIEENVYADRNMIHSSQQPPDKPPLTRGQAVNHMVRILREDQLSPPPKSHLISPQNGTNVNQPFSYIKPSVSPDGNLFVRNSPDRAPSPVNKMADKGVVYAQVIRDGDRNTDRYNKDTTPIKYSPARDKFGNLSDEDEGLGYEERYKYTKNRSYDNDFQNNNESFTKGFKITDSPIKPKFREFRLTSFDEFEPTYANDYPSPKDETHDIIDKFRGRGDGMDTKRELYEPETAKVDLDFNELSHRRQLLESRLNARRHEREKVISDEPINRYLVETDPIYEAEKKMKATERYVNETARYYRHTLERDGFAENSITEDYKKYDSENNKKYNTERRAFPKGPKDEVDGREYIGRVEPRFKDNRKVIPPEPEYEPPSLESNVAKPVTPGGYKDKKYRAKKLTSSHDALTTGQKYKVRDEYFGKRKGHYASNPEIAQERDEEYANLPNKYTESYHNSLRRVKNKDRYREEIGIRRHDSGDSRDYYERSPSRVDRLVDSGIEHDFRKDSGELHRVPRDPRDPRDPRARDDSDEEPHRTASFLDSERRHTEDNHPGEQIYANTEYLKYREDGYKKGYSSRDRSADGSRLGSKLERYEKSPSTDDKLSAKPPKAKKLSGLEKVKQLFSRDSSKKSRKEKEEKPERTRVLTSPEHHARRDSEYRRYTDPEPSEIIVKKVNYECSGDERRDSPEEPPRAEADRRRSPEKPPRVQDRRRSPSGRGSDLEASYNYEQRYERSVGSRYQARREVKSSRYSSERDSDRPSDGDERSPPAPARARARANDSPALAERYRGRRRLATPSPSVTPSPPRRQPTPATATAPAPAAPTSWFKSLDRLTRKKNKAASTKVEKESVLTTEDESSRKVWSKSKAPLGSPAKNLRFFGDTDLDSDANASHSTVTKSKSHPQSKSSQTRHGTLRKTISSSTNGLDEVDHSALSSKSYSLSNLHREEKRESVPKVYKRNLQNITEHSHSETESNAARMTKKPPINPYDRSRSHSSSKTLKAERRSGERERGSSADLRGREGGERGSSSELRGSKPDLNRDLKHRRRAPAPQSGESSTEGDSSHQSQRSVVYLHATTVGDIPDPARARDDASSVASSSPHVRSTTRSFSLFAPWTPRRAPARDLHYAQRPRREPMKKAASTRTLNEERPTLQKNKSYSQSTLTKRPASSRLSGSSQTLGTRGAAGRQEGAPRRAPRARGPAGDEREQFARSFSMPKDAKKPGWFKLTSKNKKPELTSRVR